VGLSQIPPRFIEGLLDGEEITKLAKRAGEIAVHSAELQAAH
jgi:hypothetical protein